MNKQGISPYPISTLASDLALSDKGVAYQGIPIRFEPQRLLITRQLRCCLWSYIKTKLEKLDFWGPQCQLVLDLDGNPPLVLPLPSSKDRLLVSNSSSYNRKPVRCGEAEVACLVWALRYQRTHHIQLWSQDSDIIPLTLLHAAKMTWSCVVKLSGQYVLDAQLCVRQARQLKLSLPTVALALMINGTDYIDRKELFPRLRFNAVIKAVLASGPAQDYQRNGGGSSSSSRPTEFPVLLRKEKTFVQWVQLMFTGKSYCPPPEVISTGLKKIRFNWTYWLKLQDQDQVEGEGEGEGEGEDEDEDEDEDEHKEYNGNRLFKKQRTK
jgi:hypothetical protein